MNKIPMQNKKKIMFALFIMVLAIVLLICRLFYIQTVKAPELQKLAKEQHTRDRLIPANRGSIIDRNGVGIAITKSVSSISVIPVQTRGQEEKIAKTLAEKLDIDYQEILDKLKNNVALERVKTKVDKDLADEIRELALDGVVVDEDIKRIYPYENLASQVIGFVGKDNQGIIGLESYYEKYLKGEEGKILTETDAKGVNIKDSVENRIAPTNGQNLHISLDLVIQEFAEQTIKKVVNAKKAKSGSIIVMNPQNGEILALANEPNFNLNEPFKINDEELEAKWEKLSDKERNDALNKMWRNTTINDTYEPGSTFKIITSAAGLEEGVIKTDSTFYCPGYHMVADRMIKCWRYPRNHGSINFVEGLENSCNPVFMITAERLGVDKFYEYIKKFELDKVTGLDLPGEAGGIFHKQDAVGPVELATMSFGQSFQITPFQLLRSVSAVINGGHLVTPHIGVKISDENMQVVEELKFKKSEQIISEKTSNEMKEILESVVFTGTGNRVYVPGYRIGGKTATSEKLPRKQGKYIASFLAFAPAENPEIIALVIVDEPEGVYYGGQVAGPVMKELLSNILPHLGIEAEYSEKEIKDKEIFEEIADVEMPDLIGKSIKEVELLLKDLGIDYELEGEGELVLKQFPKANERINKGSKVIIKTN